jgi:hypothetical protein
MRSVSIGLIIQKILSTNELYKMSNRCYYIDAHNILRFTSEIKTRISPSEIKMLISLHDVRVPTSSQWKLSISIQQ